MDHQFLTSALSEALRGFQTVEHVWIIQPHIVERLVLWKHEGVVLSLIETDMDLSDYTAT